MLNRFIDAIHEHYADDPQSAKSVIQAISKIVFLDIDLVIHSYLDAKDDALRRMLVASTELRAEMWGYSDALNLVADDIKSSIDSLAERIPELNDSKAGNSSTERKEIQQQFTLLQTQADELRVETHSLEHHLSQLPMSEKLYLPKEGPLTRLFHKIFAKKHYYRH
jgi:predicted GNAT family acetyltransferase